MEWEKPWQYQILTTIAPAWNPEGFDFALKGASEKRFLPEKVDTTRWEANAAMRGIVPKDTGGDWNDLITERSAAPRGAVLKQICQPIGGCAASIPTLGSAAQVTDKVGRKSPLTP
jgi:hypothetical protein